MTLQRELVNMLRLLNKVFTLLLLFSFLGFGEDFEKLCDEEVSKKDFNISLVQKACYETAKRYDEQMDIENASGYYLIANKLNNILKFEKNIEKDASATYVNIGHVYMLLGNSEQAHKYYKKFLMVYHNPNPSIQNDFKELLRFYPFYKKQLIKGKEIWKELYYPLKKLDALYEEVEAYKDSKKNLNEIIKIKEKYLKNTLSIASDYQNLALILEYQYSQYDEALYLYGKALNIFLKLLGENYFDTATVYYNIANIYNTKGDYTEALELFQHVLKVDLLLFGEENSETSATYHNMANVNANIGSFKKAFELYQKSLQIDLKILEDKEHDHIMATYHGMANILSYQGKYDEALKLYFKVLEVDLKRGHEQSIETASLYHNIANAFKDKAEYQKSLDYYHKSLKITVSLVGEKHAETITTLHNIAYVYHYLGNYKKALDIYFKVLNLDLEIFGLNHPHTATTYHHIAYIYQDKKMYSEALAIYNMSLDIREAILGEHHISTASTYHNIGNILEDLEHYDEALEQYHKALKIEIDILGVEHPTTANSYHNIANVLQSQKHYEESLSYYYKALKANLKNLRKNHPTIAINYHNIGISLFYQKQYKEAYEATKKSFDIFLKNRQINIINLDNREKENYLSHNRDIMRISHLFKTLLFYNKQQPQKELIHNGLSYWLNYKGSIFEYQNILSMIEERSKESNTIENIQNLRALTLQLAKLENTHIHKRTKNYNERKKEIKKQIHNIQIILSKQTPQFKELLGLNHIDSTLIANTLKPHQLYLDFVRGEKNYYVFTLDKSNHITFQQISEKDSISIEKNIQAFRTNNNKMANAISNKQLTKKLNQELKKESQQILSTIYNKLFKNYLQEQVKSKSSLIISPDGVLNFLPFEALYNEQKYLIEKYAINYISSGRELIRQSKRKKQKSSEKVVVFGSPDFWLKLPKNNASSLTKDVISQENATIFDIEFTTLEISKQEIATMKHYYPKLEVYQEENATVENLFKIQNPKILHISTHGFFLDNKNNPNPMLATALAFAGANYANYKNDARGIATALKLSGLKLQHTELVVLSACETGLGKIDQAEGVTGLPKAFIQAGAKHVMMSLWSVSSKETVTLMQHFYENIHKGDNYATALHKAKLQMITMHPYYWSAFIMSGI